MEISLIQANFLKLETIFVEEIFAVQIKELIFLTG